MMNFWKKLTIGNLVCIKTRYSFKLAKTLSMTKNKSLRSWYFEITLIDALGHVDQKKLLPISWEHFWALILSLDRNDINNFGPKDKPFKTILTWEEMFRLGRPSMAGIVARSRQIVRIKKKNKRKIDCHVMHLKILIKSKRESR